MLGYKKYLDENNSELVVVGVDCNHTGNRRLAEYCPFKPETTHLESLPSVRPAGKKTAEWFVNILKPEIEKKISCIYRSKTYWNWWKLYGWTHE